MKTGIPVVKEQGATILNLDFNRAEYGQAPKFREDECVKCGVEQIAYKGTDPLTGILLFVGDRCRYHIVSSEDFEVLP